MTRECAACGGSFDSPLARVATCPDCARACVICGAGHKTRGLCGAHHVQWSRAGKPPQREFIAAVKAGLPMGRARRACEICATVFSPYGPQQTCSEDCARERRRRKDLAHYHRSPTRKARCIAWQKRKRESDPAWAQGVDARKWQRVKADPGKTSKARAKAKAHYARHAATIQARRKQQLAKLSPEELAERRRRSIGYTERWRAANPEKFLTAQAEARQRRRARDAMRNLLAVQAALIDRQTGESKIKPCLICGRPVVGRKAQAKLCGAEDCGVTYRRLIQARSRARRKYGELEQNH